MTRQWNRAVDTVCANPRSVTDTAAADPTFLPRCGVVVAAVATVQGRTDAASGRWARPGGLADRRLLDVACELMLAAVTTDIELDTRRLGMLAGIGRDTARVALLRLAKAGAVPRRTVAAAPGQRARPSPSPHSGRCRVTGSGLLSSSAIDYLSSRRICPTTAESHIKLPAVSATGAPTGCMSSLRLLAG